MPTVVITSAGQVIVCSSNVYKPFLYNRLPSGCVSFVGREPGRPSYVIHVSFGQQETKRRTARSIIEGNIVLIPPFCCIDRTLDFYSEVPDAILDYNCGRPDCRCVFNPLNPELNPICYLLALLEAHHFLHVSRIRVKLLTFRLLMSYTYGAPILDVSRSHTTTQHSR